MAMAMVPMNHPSAGPQKNAVAFIRSTISHAVMTFFTLLPLKQALSLSHRRYSFSTIARIACCTALTVEAVCIPLAFAWRFPVPFREMIGLPVWITSVCVYNYVFAARTMRCLWRRHHLQRYVPIVGVQVFLLYFLLGLSVWFSYLSILPQTVMVLTFPFIKLALKNLLWKYARELGDISTDVSICMLEVSGSLYQTVCLQFVTSPILSVLIMVSDIVQAIHEVRTYMKIDYEGDGRRTLVTAMAIVDSAMQADLAERDHEQGGAVAVPNFRGSVVVPSDCEEQRVVDEAPEVVIMDDTHHTSTSAKRRPFTRQGSSETLRPKPIGRMSSMESLRTARLHRQSSMESLRSLFMARQASVDWLRSIQYRPSGDGDDSHCKFRLQLRGKSVYLHPTNVRRVAASRRRRSTRRLLDLDRAATNAASSHEVSETTTDIHVDKPTDRVKSVAGNEPPRLRRLLRQSRTSTSDWLCRVVHRQPAHSSKVYAVRDDALIATPRRRAEIKTEGSRPRCVDTKQPGMRPTPSLEPSRSAAPMSARLHETDGRLRSIRIDGIQIPRRHQARVLEQTLQLLFVCEVLLFAEYMEVVIPVLYALVLGGEWLTPNAQYNVVVSVMTGEQAAQQVWTSLLYALLELASLLVMYVVMRRKYGVSAFYQLAFVLEKYWMTLQGKLVGAFIVVLNAVTVHQGTMAVNW